MRRLAGLVLTSAAILLAWPAPGQEQELADALDRLREARTAGGVAATAIRQSRRGIRQASRLLRRGKEAEALGAIQSILDDLDGIGEPPDLRARAKERLRQARDLLAQAARQLGRYQASLEAGGGLQTVAFSSLHGTVRADLPEDIRVGDTISGRVQIAPAGENPEEQRKNRAVLAELLLDFAGEQTPVGDGFLQRVVPLTRAGEGVGLAFRDPSGTELARAVAAVSPLPGHFTRDGPPRPEDFRFPLVAQIGRPLVIDGPFDGSFFGTAVDVGGTKLERLAESPRRLLCETAADLDPGPHDVTLEEGATSVNGQVNVLQLFLTATDLDLRSGQTSLVTARVEGFQGLPVEAYPIPFQMVNHSIETVHFVTLEGPAFRLQIAPQDVTPGGSFTFATTLRALRPGTFHISAIVLSPVFFAPDDPVQQDQGCGEQTRLRALCVRFFLVDACGNKDLKKARDGLFAGVEYGGKTFGKVPEKTVERFKTLLEKVNAIWRQCDDHCCWIRFFCQQGEKKPCVQAFDPKGVPAVYTDPLKIPYSPEGFRFHLWKATREEKVDLCQLFDADNPRGITVTGGNKPVKITQSVTWAKDQGPYNKGESADPVLKEKIDEAEAKDKKHWQDRARKSYKQARSALGLFSQSVDKVQGKECINVFVLDSFQDDDQSRPGDEAGYGTIRGRNVFLEDAQVTQGRGRVLAHEFGHNLSLDHVEDDENLMDEGGSGSELTKNQCDQACKGAVDKALQGAKLPDDEAAKRKKREEEERKKKEEDEKKKEEDEKKKKEARERAQERRKKIDERLGEIEKRTGKLREEIGKQEEALKKSVESFNISDAKKKKILKDNLKNQASKERAKLEKLEKEKADLEKEKAGLGED